MKTATARKDVTADHSREPFALIACNPLACCGSSFSGFPPHRYPSAPHALPKCRQTYGFLPDGTGKNLDLPRTVQTPLPGASQCNPASVGAVAAAQTPASSS